MTTSERSLFLGKCKEAYNLVQAFLNDELPLDHLELLHPEFLVSAERNEIVKSKIRKSLEVLSVSLEGHRYVSHKMYL